MDIWPFLFLGEASKRPKSLQNEVAPGDKTKPQRFISDSGEDDEELSPESTCMKQAVVLLTPLSCKKQSEKSRWPQRRPADQYWPKEGRETNGCRSLERELAHTNRKSQKQPCQNESRTESSSAEDDDSSEDSPVIRRKTQPTVRKQGPNLKSVSDQKQESDIKKPASAPKRTGDPSRPSSQSRSTRPVPAHQNGQPQSPSPPSSASDSSGIQQSERQKLGRGSQKRQKYFFESASESESSPGDFEHGREELKVINERVNGADPSSSKAAAAAGRMRERRQVWDADGSEAWTEGELQKLHR